MRHDDIHPASFNKERLVLHKTRYLGFKRQPLDVLTKLEIDTLFKINNPRTLENRKTRSRYIHLVK